MSKLEQLLRELRCDIKKDSEHSLKLVEERITKNINENIDKKFENIQSQIDQVNKNITEQNARILILEKQIRCRNIIFFGVEEGEKSYEELENKVLRIVTKDMKVDCNRSEIEITKRLGKKTENKIRPIVVTLSTYGKKHSILKNKRHLKNINIYLKEDYPQEILEKRKQLQEPLQQARNEGKIAYLRQDRLIVYEANKNQPNTAEEVANNKYPRKRELEFTPPSQMSSTFIHTTSNYQVAKKNKLKPFNSKKGQSSMSSFIQNRSDGLQKTSVSVALMEENND